MRIVHVSDTHLAAGVPFGDEHWDAVVDHVARTEPDLVVHGGDVTLDGVLRPEQLDHARERFDALTVPWLAVPGNHDIGDVDDPRRPLDVSRRDQFEDRFGPANWSRRLGAWRVVGVDVQTLSDGDPALGEWLAGELTGDGPTALFLHRPLRPWDGADDKPERYVVDPLRARLGALVDQGDVRLVASGHVHQYLRRDDDGVAHVWAPSAWAALPDHIQEVIGDKVVGVVEYDLRDDGSLSAEFVRPDGVRDVRGGEDFPSPYGP